MRAERVKCNVADNVGVTAQLMQVSACTNVVQVGTLVLRSCCNVPAARRERHADGVRSAHMLSKPADAAVRAQVPHGNAIVVRCS